MKQYKGDVKITKANAEEWAKKLKDVEVITGGVHIYQGATFTAAALVKVTGGVQIDQGATFTAAALVKVTGGVHIDQGATFTAAALTEVGWVQIYQGATFTAAALVKVTGWVQIYQGATFTAAALTEVGGVQIDATLPDDVEKILWEAGKGQRWEMGNNASDWMLSQQGNITYKINEVQFDKGMFRKIRGGELTAAEVFALRNMEQRRVAYEKMDKIKMKDLDGLQVLHEVKDDGCGYPMRIVSFNLPGVSAPFLYLNCHCPSGGREYYLETRQKDCWAAKAASFGLTDVEWVAEY